MNAEEKQALIERCKTISSWREKYGDFANVMLPAVEAQQIAEIAFAALTAQPVAYTDEEELKVMRQGTYADMFTPHDSYKSDPQWIPLFTRPAPAVSLAELVPEQVSIRQAIAALENHEYCPTPASGYKAGVNDTITAILRNIEEAK